MLQEESYRNGRATQQRTDSKMHGEQQAHQNVVHILPPMEKKLVSYTTMDKLLYVLGSGDLSTIKAAKNFPAYDNVMHQSC